MKFALELAVGVDSLFLVASVDGLGYFCLALRVQLRSRLVDEVCDIGFDRVDFELDVS